MPPVAWATSSLAGWRASRANGWNVQFRTGLAAACYGRAGCSRGISAGGDRACERQGYRGASVEQIAARLNLTKGSFYHHYSSKEELVAACFERTFDVIRHTQMLAMERMDSGWDRLSAAARVLVRFQISEQGPLVRTTAWNALPPELRTDSQRRFDRLTEKFSIFIVEECSKEQSRHSTPGSPHSRSRA